jgi:hypothetical protein
MFCIYCGASNPANAKFCNDCGKNITVSAPSSEGIAPQILTRQFSVEGSISPTETAKQDVSSPGWEADSSSRLSVPRIFIAVAAVVTLAIGTYWVLSNHPQQPTSSDAPTANQAEATPVMDPPSDITGKYIILSCSNSLELVATERVTITDEDGHASMQITEQYRAPQANLPESSNFALRVALVLSRIPGVHQSFGSGSWVFKLNKQLDGDASSDFRSLDYEAYLEILHHSELKNSMYLSGFEEIFFDNRDSHAVNLNHLIGFTDDPDVKVNLKDYFFADACSSYLQLFPNCGADTGHPCAR